jgi:CTP synthase
VNQKYLPQLQEGGLQVAGMSPDGKFVEMVELTDHPWFLGCQFHPEYKSRPTDPHPLFVSYIKAALGERERRRDPARVAEREQPSLAQEMV